MGFGPSDAEWERYTQDLFEFSKLTALQTITWRKLTKRISRFGEDKGTSFTDITLKGLIHYNAFRVWPINKIREVGTDDKEYLHILLNNEYLKSLGLLNAHSYFKFNPFEDRFIVNGITYRTSGDTPISQGKSAPLYSIVILERDIVNTPDIQR